MYRKRSRDRVQINCDRGMLRLRFTYRGKRRSLSLGIEDTRINRGYAFGIAQRIELDIRSNQLDESLNRYRPTLIGNCGMVCDELFSRFTRHKRLNFGLSTRTIQCHYLPLVSHLKQWMNKPAHQITIDEARDFVAILSERNSASTVKRRIWLLSAAWEWAKEQSLITTVNPWIGLAVALKPVPKQPTKPFTKQELDSIIQTFRGHKYYAVYADFVYFLAAIGARPSEAINLQWQHISDDFSSVWISASKTNRSRVVMLPGDVQSMLKSRFNPGKTKPDSIVFPSAVDKRIVLKNFRERAWRAVLGQCSIEYRRPYCLRHTAISLALKSGSDPIAVAEQAGHNKKILFDIYSHAMESRPVFQSVMEKTQNA